MLNRFLRWMTDLDHTLDLAQMDDRMLADMGLERGAIGRAVRGGPEAPASTPRPPAFGDPGASLAAKGCIQPATLPARLEEVG